MHSVRLPLAAEPAEPLQRLAGLPGAQESDGLQPMRGSRQPVQRCALAGGDGVPPRFRYKTPLNSEIDKVGIQPDRACTLGAPGEVSSQGLSGLPIGSGAMQAVAAQLQTDSCILTAERILGPQLAAVQPQLVVAHKPR